MATLVHYIYVSTATHNIEPWELTNLLEAARANNRKLGVTGILVYMGGRFFQVLEGDPEVLKTLYEKIALDPRHKAVTKIIDEVIAKRQFGEWPMGFSDLSRRELSHISVSNGPAQASASLGNLPDGRARKLLGAFFNGSWGAEREASDLSASTQA